MPLLNEFSCRLHDPGKYDKFARDNCKIKHDGKCIDFIYGIKSGKSEVQAMRYKKSIWTEDSAQNHCKEHKGEFNKNFQGGEEMTELKHYENLECDIPIIVKRCYTEKKKDGEEPDWIIEGYASMEGADRNEPVIEISREAMKNSEDDLLKNSTVFLNHDTNTPVGKVLDSKMDKIGLWVKILISKTAKTVWQQIKEGVMNGLSIGAKILESMKKLDEEIMRMVEVVTKMEIVEVSLVGLPAHPGTKILTYREEALMPVYDYVCKALQKSEIKDIGEEGGEKDMSEVVEKRWITVAEENEMPDSHFLWVRHKKTGNKSEDRKLPYKDSSGKLSRAGLRGAWAVLHGARGGADLAGGPSNKECLAKCERAIGRWNKEHPDDKINISTKKDLIEVIREMTADLEIDEEKVVAITKSIEENEIEKMLKDDVLDKLKQKLTADINEALGGSKKEEEPKEEGKEEGKKEEEKSAEEKKGEKVEEKKPAEEKPAEEKKEEAVKEEEKPAEEKKEEEKKEEKAEEKPAEEKKEEKVEEKLAEEKKEEKVEEKVEEKKPAEEKPVEEKKEESKEVEKALRAEVDVKFGKYTETLEGLKKSLDEISKKVMTPEQIEEAVKKVIKNLPEPADLKKSLEIQEEDKEEIEKGLHPKQRLTKHIQESLNKK